MIKLCSAKSYIITFRANSYAWKLFDPVLIEVTLPFGPLALWTLSSFVSTLSHAGIYSNTTQLYWYVSATLYARGHRPLSCAHA